MPFRSVDVTNITVAAVILSHLSHVYNVLFYPYAAATLTAAASQATHTAPT